MHGPKGEEALLNIKTLNEWDSKVVFIFSCDNILFTHDFSAEFICHTNEYTL